MNELCIIKASSFYIYIFSEVKMQRIPLKRYAVQHKMSIFQVVKAIKSGRLRSETIQEDGKDVTYVLVEEEDKKEMTQVSEYQTEDISCKRLKAEMEALKSEVKLLKHEVARLRQIMGGGVVL
jgi:hypothetical protein